MVTAYSPILKLALPVQGELSGTWGDVVNDNITSMVEQAIAGRAVIDTWTTNSHVLTTANGTTSESRCAMLEFTDTGTALSGAGTVTCPTLSKIYIAKNASGQNVTLKTSGGTGILVPNGRTMFLFCDGTNVVEAVTSTTSLQLGTSTIVTAVLDEDNMASDSATSLATQQSIKAYVDSQVGANNELSEVLANGNTTGATDIAVDSAQKVQFRDAAIYINSSVDGQLDIVADTEIQIAATTIDVNGALDVSGTALVTGVLTTTAATVSNGGGQFNGAINVGVDDTGYDVKFFGATTGKSLLWDESADSLIVTGTTTLVGTTNLDVVDIDGATQIDATVTVGVDDTGYDVKFFGATAGAYMLWDESADDLILGGAVDAGVAFSALTLDMSAAGAATFNNKVTATQYNISSVGNDDRQVGVDGGGFFVYNTADSRYDLQINDVGAVSIGGVVTANAGVVVDNITIDGTTLALSSGDLTLDVAGDIILDAGGAQLRFYDDGADIGVISNESNNLIIKTQVSDADMLFKGNDGGSTITALTLDMSDGGNATFNKDILLGDDSAIRLGASQDLALFHDATDSTIRNNTGDLILDVAGDIILDSANNGEVHFYDTGSQYAQISASSGNMVIAPSGPDKDIIFKGTDDASVITALTLDMSDAGSATFNNDVNVGANFDVTGNAVIDGTVDVAGVHTVSNTTDATATTDGALIVSGGVGIAKKLFVGTDITMQTGTAVFQNLDEAPLILISGTVGDKELIDFQRDGGAASGSLTYHQSPLGFSMGDDGGHTFRLKAGGTDRLTVQTTAGNNVVVADGLTLTDGNLIVANGHGIDFSAQTGTATGTTNVEVLDHYETGSWTPTFNATDMVPGTGVGETNITYSVRSGRYTRIGDSVHITGNIITSGRSGTERAALTVDGLPFTCGTPASHSMSVSFAYNFTDNATAPLAATAQSSTSHILLYTNQTSNAQCNTSDINASGSSYFNFAGTYLVG
jgi:hypothetical protein